MLPNRLPTFCLLSFGVIMALTIAPYAHATCVPLTSLGGAYSQNFNGLASSGWANPLAITGWAMSETGTHANSFYSGDPGSSNTGDTYSFGAVGSADRALGSLQSGTLIPLFGVCFTNNTGKTINSLAIAYTGEQWRLGTAGRTDSIYFQYSTNATTLNNGGWTSVAALGFSTPTTVGVGAQDGNAAANRARKASSITALNIANGATFWLRWEDTNALSADDGLAVDDFTLTPNGSTATVLKINDVTAAEGNSGSKPYNFTVSLSAPAPAGGVKFNIATANGTATAGSDYTAKSLTNQNIPAGASNYTFTVNGTGDTVFENNESFFVNISNVTGASLADGQGIGSISNDDAASCAIPDTPIDQIQGTGASAALTGTRTVEGVVVGDYEGSSPALGGFYLQNIASKTDGNATTSDAIFVYNAGNNAVSLGQTVQVTGTVTENQGQTQLISPTIVKCATPTSIAPVTVSLPVPAPVGGVDYLERFEGMLVKFTQTLYVTEHYQLGRFGQIVLSSGKRLPQPTHITTPGTNALKQQASNHLNRLIVDDEWQTQNPNPIKLGRNGNPLSASNTLRGGDSIANLTGIMTYTWSGNAASGNAFRLRPINALAGGAPKFVASNARPAIPAAVNGVLKIAAANLLNFFNTYTNCSLGVGGSVSTANCRGAENLTEFNRQWPKTVENLVNSGAAVVVVNEIENDGYGTASAIQFLVDKLNAKTGAGTYAFINPDLTQGSNSLGTDAIKVGMIYKPSIVTKVGNTAVLNTGAFGKYQTSTGVTSRNRPALAQAFQEKATGSRFIVVGTHLKSKGSACDNNIALLSATRSTTPIAADTDQGDGQGDCNKTRTAAAEELTEWLSLNPTNTGDDDILVMGDFNAYAKEDPISAFKNAGYTNLIEKHIGVNAYSYVFDGQWGYLDYALASSSLATQVKGVSEWHINADEPSVLDYNTNYKTADQLTSLYAANALRTSDHDPVIIGLTLSGP